MKFRPELSAARLVTSYNIDSTDGLSTLERKDRKDEPRFVVIGS